MTVRALAVALSMVACGVEGDGDAAPDETGGNDVTPRCGVPVTTGLSHVGVVVDGTQRDYELFVPEGYDPSTPTPLVFAWHGRGSDGSQARLYFGIEDAAAGEAIVVYPNGLPVASQGGQTGWDLAPNGIDVAFFDEMRAQVYSAMCIDPDRVFSTGHSFGGFMSSALGCFRPDALRAIGSVAAGPPFAACEPGRVAAIVMHGTLDEVVPFEQGVMARDGLLARNGCATTSAPVDPEPCVAYDGCDPGYDVRWCEHSEEALMGHMWPTFAGAAIWEFFAGLAPEIR